MIFLLSLAVFSGCDRETSMDFGNKEVDNYVQSLLAGQCKSGLPAFTEKDIPALLKYRDDTRIIKNFPYNPISSYCCFDCRLGMYVLWTIESIRANSTGGKNVILGYPSQTPILALRDATSLILVDDDESHKTAAQAYYHWWRSNDNKKFDTFNMTDPLANTKYRWH